MTRVVVLGGGFAGMETLRCLERGLGRRDDVELTLVSDTNYLLFTPLLPQVASSLVEPRHIIQPIRDIRGGRRRFRFRRDRVTGIDLGRRMVQLSEVALPYDVLVLALGGVTPTFGTPGVAEHALEYKTLPDAMVLRDHLLDLAEHADHEPDAAARRRMLTVCVVGGGYTGVELTAELEDFFSSYVVPRYRGIGPDDYRLMILEAGDEILRGVHPTLAARARGKLFREGIEIRTGTRVTRVLPGAVEVAGGAQLPVGITVWAAGVRGHPVLAPLPVARDPIGRVVVDRFMQVPGQPGVYGAGDAVSIDGMPSASIPIIPAALAHARLVATNILADLEGAGRETIEFAPRGMLVSLGERDAVVEVMGLRFSGYFAWLFWNTIHLLKLVGVRKQLQVALDWALAGVFPRDSAIMRPASRCPVCRAHALTRAERDAA
ncbi:MAG: NAD(P)/FAD-dependent oxidoreductase [Candidatus Rokubacteria bacterium]|nr:NAD(P)/FAD-dependent oxidoreductase [Candidatus Rokubacteria bacterium]